jgi:hypothetical protein
MDSGAGDRGSTRTQAWLIRSQRLQHVAGYLVPAQECLATPIRSAAAASPVNPPSIRSSFVTR